MEFTILAQRIIENNPVIFAFGQMVLVGGQVLFSYTILWVYHTNKVNAQILANEKSMQLELQSSKLENLRSQLNPHFLFNCMNNIRALMFIDNSKASMSINNLTHILRYSLETDTDLVRFADDFSVIQSYIELEKTRLGKRLEVDISISDNIDDWLVPPILLQPIVENAIAHGISKSVKGGLLKITTSIGENNLVVTIINDGTLNGDHTGQGIGLRNSKERLKLTYSRDDLLSITESDGKVSVQIILPWTGEKR